jgi:hypothetical protein
MYINQYERLSLAGGIVASSQRVFFGRTVGKISAAVFRIDSTFHAGFCSLTKFFCKNV